jgi:hypothetical protein
MSKSVLGGTSYPRYSDPLVSGAPNQFGLYAWSVYKARLSVLSGVGGTVSATSTLVTTNAVSLLLFTSDVPAIAQINITDTAATAPPQLNYAANATTASFLYTTSGGSTTATPAYGQVAQGFAGTAKNISCSGFAASVTLAFAGGSAAEAVDVLVWANSPNICSPVAPNDPAGVLASATPTAPTPIILRNSDYATSIREADNLIVDAAGKSYIVVGLYA